MTSSERLAVAITAALGLGAGVGLVAAAFTSRRRPPTARPWAQVNPTTVAAAIAVGAVVLVVTRWPIAAAAAVVMVVVWSSLFQSVAATRERRRVDAIAKWLEDLRDLQRGSNLDLPQALERSAVRAPKDLAAELSRFVDRTRHHTPIEVALLALAADLDHPTSDMAIASMLFAHGHASGSVLHETFAELAASARDEVTARDQVDRLRTRFESSMRRMLLILAGLIGYLLVASRETIAEYDTAAGQAYLVLPIGIWAFALWWLRQLSRYRRTGRYLDHTAVAARSGAGQ